VLRDRPARPARVFEEPDDIDELLDRLDFAGPT
jgi:hypothetical protein